MPTITFDERLDMLQEAARGWVDLKRAIASISDEAMTKPNTVGEWSGTDLLAHIANWEEVALNVIERLEAGEPGNWPKGETDELNAEMVARYRDASLEEVKEYLETTHFALMDLAERARNVTPNMVLGVTSRHYVKHMDDLAQVARS